MHVFLGTRTLHPPVTCLERELDSYTYSSIMFADSRTVGLAAGISIEEAPSVEMSPLELQVLMDKRHGQLGQHDNRQQLSPRLQYQVGNTREQQGICRETRPAF